MLSYRLVTVKDSHFIKKQKQKQFMLNVSYVLLWFSVFHTVLSVFVFVWTTLS